MPRLGAAEVPIGAVAATAAARSQFEDLGAAALSQCAAQAIGAMDIGVAATGIGATVSVRQRSARPLLARPLLAVLRTAVTATTPTATGFAATNPSSLALGAQPASTSRSTPGAVIGEARPRRLFDLSGPAAHLPPARLPLAGQRRARRCLVSRPRQDVRCAARSVPAGLRRRNAGQRQDKTSMITASTATIPRRSTPLGIEAALSRTETETSARACARSESASSEAVTSWAGSARKPSRARVLSLPGSP